MSSPYVGEIRMFGGSFAPAGWAMCQGQLLPISQNETLFNLIGTTFGGDGQSTFAVPDLQGRAPVHSGKGPAISQTYTLGEQGGVEQVTLTTQQIPIHNHAVLVTQDLANSSDPTNQLYAQSTQIFVYTQDTASKFFFPGELSPAGGSQPHENMQPYLVITFIISLFGIFPSQNTALFSLLGTFYGGDGKSTFALPNLQDSVPLGQGQSSTGSLYDLGQQSGVSFVTLIQTEMPIHTHNLGGSGNQGDLQVGAPDAVLAQSSPGQAYQTVTNQNITQFSPFMISIAGGSLPHNNMMPYLALTAIIALQGIFPPRT